MSNKGNEVYKEKLDIREIILRHLDRVNLAASYSYESAVKQSLNILPTSSREFVEAVKDEKYQDTKDVFVFKTRSGVRQGNKADPLVWSRDKKGIGLSSDDGFDVDRYDDGTVDWNDPRIISPKLKSKAFVDYHAMDSTIMDAYQEAGFTFNQELTTVKVATIMPPFDDKPLPDDYGEEEYERDTKTKI